MAQKELIHVLYKITKCPELLGISGLEVVTSYLQKAVQ